MQAGRNYRSRAICGPWRMRGRKSLLRQGGRAQGEHRGNSIFPCTPSPDRRLFRAVDPYFQIDSTAETVCYHFESIRSCWRNPGCRQGSPPLPPPWIPGCHPPEAQKAAGYATPGRSLLPGSVHPAAFRLSPAPFPFDQKGVHGERLRFALFMKPFPDLPVCLTVEIKAEKQRLLVLPHITSRIPPLQIVQSQ